MTITSSYIHIPFCKELCHYCDFNKVYIKNQPVSSYLDGLEKEISMTFMGERKKMDTVYIGGGTPSALSLPDLERLLRMVHSNMNFNYETEFTFEANPNDLSGEMVSLLHQYQVNRISLGAQTFHNAHLEYINRKHTDEDIFRAVHLLSTLGITNINLDFIYGLPNQKLDNWKETLIQAVQLPITHISAYSMIVEPKTYFYNLEREGKLQIPSQDEEAEMYELAMKFLPSNGFLQYEISNYAKKGYESKHNLVYWRNEEYFGFGAGAHSYEQSVRIKNLGPVNHYIRSLKGDNRPILNQTSLTKKEQMEEQLFLGLRTSKGVNKKEFEKKFKQSLEMVFNDAIKIGTNRGLLKETADAILLTKEGKMLGNDAFELFLFNE